MSEATEFFQVGGPLSEDAPSYIERPADKELLTALERGELCLVLAPRQSGKSSLMVHALARLREKRIQAGIVDLQQLGSHEALDRGFSDVVYQIERSLRLETDSTEWWEANNRLGPTQRFMTFLEDVVLAEVTGNVVIFFDEIDSILPRPFSDDFFTTLRSLYNARVTNPTLKRLSFVLLGVATASAFVKDRSRTPFNIGRSIELGDFDKASTEPFQHVLGPESEPLVNRIFYWTSGQPFLIQKLAATAFSWTLEERNAEKLDEEVKASYLHRKIEQDTHLKFMQDYLLDTSTNVRKTLKAYDQILRGKKIPYDDQSAVQNRLKLAGVVRVEDKKLAPRNRIYQSIFNLQWVKQHIPREIEKKVIYSVASVLAVLFLWVYIVQPLFFPRFPGIPKIGKYSAEPSVEIELSVANANVSRATLDGKDITIQGDLIWERLGSLPVGESQHELQLIGGVFEKTYTIQIEVVHYPNWEIRQFPDKRLEQLNPILRIDGNKINLKNVMNGNVFGDFNNPYEITNAFLTPDRRLIFSSKDGYLWLQEDSELEWIVEGKRKRTDLKLLTAHNEPILNIALSPDGKTFISGGSDGTLKIWDVKNREKLRELKGHSGAVHSVVYSPTGKFILSGSEDRTLKLWDIITGQELNTFSAHEGAVYSVAFSPDGRTVLSGSEDSMLKLWDMETGETLQTLEGHSGTVRSVAFSPDGKWILSGGDDMSVKLWDTATAHHVQTFNVDKKIKDVKFSPDSQLILARDIENELYIWDAITGQKLQVFVGHKDGVTTVDFSPNGKRIISGSSDTTLKLWDIETGKMLRTFTGHSDTTRSFFLPDGKRVISGSDDATLNIWDVETGQKLMTFSGHLEGIFDVVSSPDGNAVVSGGMDKIIRLWDIKTGQILKIFVGHQDFVYDIEFSPNGKTILSASYDKTIKLWNIQMGQELHTFSGHNKVVTGVAFSPNGKLAISCSFDKMLKLWDVEMRQELRSFSGHSEPIWAVAFSPNGKYVVSGSADRTVKLWDVETGQVLRTFSGHQGTVYGVAFSPDGRTVISASADGTLKLWWAVVEEQ